MSFLQETDRLIQEAQQDPQAPLHGLDAGVIFHDPRFYGTPEEAEALAALPPVASTMTADQLVSLAQNLKQPAPGTIREWNNCLRLLQEHTRSLFPLSLTASEARNFRDQLLKTYKTSTAQKILRFLKGLHELAVEEGVVQGNPYNGLLKRVRSPQREDKPSIPPETWSLVESLPEGNKTLFWLIAYTGLRISEALGLRQQDINLEEGAISVVPYDLRPLKNESSRRRIPIDERLLPFLQAKMKSGSDLIFPEHLSPSGRWTTPSFWQRRLGFGPHLLRHGVTTKLRMAGTGESVVAALLGHVPPSMTSRYGAVPLESLREAVRRLEWP